MSQTTSTRNPLPWWIKVPIGLAILVLLIMGTLFMAGRAATAKWQAYAAELRAKGQPLTVAEIEDSRPTIPEKQNGARVIEKLIQEIQASGINQTTNIASGLKTPAPKHTLNFDTSFGPVNGVFNFKSGIPRYAIEPTRQFLNENREILDGLSRLSDCTNGRFTLIDDPLPYNILMPHLSSVRSYGRLLGLQTTINLIDGDTAAAVENIRCNFNLANSMSGEPTLISRLVSIAVQALIVNDIGVALNSGVLTEEHYLKELQRLLAFQLAASNDMKNALLGERACFATMCEQFALKRVPPGSYLNQGHWAMPLNGPVYSLVAIIRSNQIRGTELLTPLVEAADDPVALIKAAKEMEAEVPKLRFTQFIVKMLLPSMSRAAQLNARSYAELRCALTAVAAERFRLKNERFPASLEELVPEFLDAVPIDPFDGNPLRFLANDDGLIFYSIHEDLIDDGGSIDVLEKEHKPRDWGFRLLRPDLRGIKITDEPPPSEDDE